MEGHADVTLKFKGKSFVQCHYSYTRFHSSNEAMKGGGLLWILVEAGCTNAGIAVPNQFIQMLRTTYR